MPEYIVVVKVTAGYLVRVNAERPEEALTKVEMMKLRDMQTEQFFVNTDCHIGDVWDVKGNVVVNGK